MNPDNGEITTNLRIFNSILSSHEAKNKAQKDKAVAVNATVTQPVQANKTAEKSVNVTVNATKPVLAVPLSVKAEVKSSSNVTANVSK